MKPRFIDLKVGDTIYCYCKLINTTFEGIISSIDYDCANIADNLNYTDILLLEFDKPDLFQLSHPNGFCLSFFLNRITTEYKSGILIDNIPCYIFSNREDRDYYTNNNCQRDTFGSLRYGDSVYGVDLDTYESINTFVAFRCVTSMILGNGVGIVFNFYDLIDRYSSSSITLKVLDSYVTLFTTKELRDDYALNLDLNEDNKEI